MAIYGLVRTGWGISVAIIAFMLFDAVSKLVCTHRMAHRIIRTARPNPAKAKPGIGAGRSFWEFACHGSTPSSSSAEPVWGALQVSYADRRVSESQARKIKGV
jgi:hypothetical protein